MTTTSQACCVGKHDRQEKPSQCKVVGKLLPWYPAHYDEGTVNEKQFGRGEKRLLEQEPPDRVDCSEKHDGKKC
jgi:hypothetical protein